MKQPLNEQFRRMQKLAGILNEGKDQILSNLDKVAKESIRSYGMEDYPMEVTTDPKQQTIALRIYGDFSPNPGRVATNQNSRWAIIQPIIKHIDDYLKEVHNKLDPNDNNFTIRLKDSNTDKYTEGGSIGHLHFLYQLIFKS